MLIKLVGIRRLLFTILMQQKMVEIWNKLAHLIHHSIFSIYHSYHFNAFWCVLFLKYFCFCLKIYAECLNVSFVKEEALKFNLPLWWGNGNASVIVIITSCLFADEVFDLKAIIGCPLKLWCFKQHAVVLQWPVNNGRGKNFSLTSSCQLTSFLTFCCRLSLFFEALCYRCDLMGQWFHWSLVLARNIGKWSWMAIQCSSTRTFRFPNDYQMSRNRSCWTWRLSDSSPSTRTSPLYRTMPIGDQVNGNIDKLSSSSTQASKGSFARCNIGFRRVGSS